MKEDIIKQRATELALYNINNIYLFDNINDNIEVYQFSDGVFTLKENKNLTEYLDYINTNLKQEFVSGYMNSISVPKLEEEKRNGNDVVIYSYTTLNNETYTNLSTVVEVDNKSCVFVIEVKLDANNKTNGSDKYNNFINVLSDSILKIQNVFNLDSKSLSNVKALEEYIMSIFSNLYGSYPELKKSVNKIAANVSGRWEDAILIIDDDKVMRSMIKKVFKNDTYKLVELANGKEAIEYLEANEAKGKNEASDHVLGVFLDLTMPVLDGFAVLEYLSKKNYLNRMPVIIISGDYEKETKSRVYNYNIADMLEKPFDFEVVRHRITNLINLYKSSNSLNDLISSQNNDLKNLLNTFVDAYRYDYSANIDKISEYINVLASQVMNDYPEYELTEEKIGKMKDAAMYYDIGFYSIPKSVLVKKDKLTNEELALVRNYPLFGSKMIEYVLSLTSDELYKKYALNIAKYYHENYNGTGYPKNLKEDEIPIESQIAAVCITYNNLKKKNVNAISFVIEKSGVMFNPKLIESLKKVKERFEII